MAVGEQDSAAGAPGTPAVTIELPLLDGRIALSGPLKLSIPLPGAATTLDLPLTLDGTTNLHSYEPGCVSIDALGTLHAPLVLRLPLAEWPGLLDVDIQLGGDARLRMSLPGVEGRLQANLRAAGPAALRLDLPRSSARIDARTTLNTPLTLALLLPSGRAKLNAQDSVTLELSLRLQPEHGGSVEVDEPLEVSFNGTLFLPSGSGRLQATAPFRTQVRLRRLLLPQLQQALSLDICVEGGAELNAELPGNAQIRAYFTAGLPVAPLLHLLRAELARHVEVQHIEAGTPQLRGAYDLELPLLIVARRGVQAKVEVVTQLHIEPRNRQVVLRSVHAEGLNAAGRAAAWLYINPYLLRSLRNTVLFDPLLALPPEARIEALAFKAAGRDELSVEGVVGWSGTIRE